MDPDSNNFLRWRRMFVTKLPKRRQHFSFIPLGNEDDEYILFGG